MLEIFQIKPENASPDVSIRETKITTPFLSRKMNRETVLSFDTLCSNLSGLCTFLIPLSTVQKL